jgi:hypothetical protein
MKTELLMRSAGHDFGAPAEPRPFQRLPWWRRYPLRLPKNAVSGDRVQFTAPCRDERIANRQLADAFDPVPVPRPRVPRPDALALKFSVTFRNAERTVATRATKRKVQDPSAFTPGGLPISTLRD